MQAQVGCKGRCIVCSAGCGAFAAAWRLGVVVVWWVWKCGPSRARWKASEGEYRRVAPGRERDIPSILYRIHTFYIDVL